MGQAQAKPDERSINADTGASESTNISLILQMTPEEVRESPTARETLLTLLAELGEIQQELDALKERLQANSDATEEDWAWHQIGCDRRDAIEQRIHALLTLDEINRHLSSQPDPEEPGLETDIAYQRLIGAKLKDRILTVEFEDGSLVDVELAEILNDYELEAMDGGAELEVEDFQVSIRTPLTTSEPIELSWLELRNQSDPDFAARLEQLVLATGS